MYRKYSIPINMKINTYKIEQPVIRTWQVHTQHVKHTHRAHEIYTYMKIISII
jgi:hypothetical protein